MTIASGSRSCGPGSSDGDTGLAAPTNNPSMPARRRLFRASSIAPSSSCWCWRSPSCWSPAPCCSVCCSPRYVSAVAIEYGAAFFFFFLAAAAFRAGILGRRVKPRVWQPGPGLAGPGTEGHSHVLRHAGCGLGICRLQRGEVRDRDGLSPSPFSSCWQATPQAVAPPKRRLVTLSPCNGAAHPRLRPGRPRPCESPGRRSTPAGFCCCWPLSVSPSA